MGANLYLHTLPTPPICNPTYFLYPEDNLSRPTPNLPILPHLPYPTYTYIVTGLSKISVFNVTIPYTPNVTHTVFTYSKIQYFWNPLKFPVFAKVQTFNLYIDLYLECVYESIS